MSTKDLIGYMKTLLPTINKGLPFMVADALGVEGVRVKARIEIAEVPTMPEKMFIRFEVFLDGKDLDVQQSRTVEKFLEEMGFMGRRVELISGSAMS